MNKYRAEIFIMAENEADALERIESIDKDNEIEEIGNIGEMFDTEHYLEIQKEIQEKEDEVIQLQTEINELQNRLWKVKK